MIASISCASSEDKSQSDAPTSTVASTSTTIPAIDVGEVQPIAPPTVAPPIQDISSAAYDLLCLGATRSFPAHLGTYSQPLDDAGTIAAWREYLAGATIVDSNSFIKSFDLRTDGTGVWIDSELRPVLHGREFDWEVVLVDGDEWNDVDLTLTFAEFDYIINLPLRWRVQEIVDPYETEGLIVTETRDCGEFQAVADSGSLPGRLWQAPPDLDYGSPRETIPTAFKPGTILYAEDHFYVNSAPGFWAKINRQGEVLIDFRATRASARDQLFDGEFLWFTDPGEGEIHKFDLDGNKLLTIRLTSPKSIAHDGDNYWVNQTSGTTLFKLSSEGEKLLEIELPSRPDGGEVEVFGERVWVGLDEEWSVNSYSLDGELLSSTYLQGAPNNMVFDGEHIWVSVDSNSQIRKLNLDGQIVQTVDLTFGDGVGSFEFAAGALWALSDCCDPNINGSKINRFNLEGKLTDRYWFAYKADSMEFDGNGLWLSHTENRAFTKLSVESTGAIWRTTLGPYTEQELIIETGKATIAGTLTIPNTPGPHPAVIMVANIYTDGRDGQIIGANHGHLTADNFARQGMAVFRYDQRGSGISSGRVFDYEWRDLADDLHVIVDTIQSHPSVDANQVGLWALGASVWVGTPVIAERDDIAFAVFMNQTGTDPLTQSFGPQLLAIRFSTQPPEQFEYLVEQYNTAINIIREGRNWREFEDLQRTLANDAVLASGVFDNVIDLPFFSLREMEGKFWASVIDFDMGPYLVAIDDTPYIAIYGGLNLLIHPEFFEPATLEAIERSGNPDARTVVFERMNDILQPAISGQREEYRTRPQVMYPSYIRPGFMEYVSNWIFERVEFVGGDR